MTTSLNAILLLYYEPPLSGAVAMREHIQAFQQHSQYDIVLCNTYWGYPKALGALRFSVIVVHYSLFGDYPYCVGERFSEYLALCEDSFKIAFFQDEYRYCQERFTFINNHGIQCIYTGIPELYQRLVYGAHTCAEKQIFVLPGYVSDRLLRAGERWALPQEQRKIDVGYRARRLPYYLGDAGWDKVRIAQEFCARFKGKGLRMDISVEEEDRIYGDAWYRFLGNCRYVLGTEGGSSIVDLDGRVREQYCDALRLDPSISYEAMNAAFLHRYQERIAHRKITPRHFEAAAMRSCQILLEGDYSGILKPMIHYIPLKKDFSNCEDVLACMRDHDLCDSIVEQCYEDLIRSERYSYCTFLRSFDRELQAMGLEPSEDSAILEYARKRLRPAKGKKIVMASWHRFRYGRFPGRLFLRRFIQMLRGHHSRMSG